MDKIHIKWVNNVNWRYINEWDYSEPNWDAIEVDDNYILYKNEFAGVENISKNILNKGVRYRVTFEITSNYDGDFYGQIRLQIGEHLSPIYSSVGQYEYINNVGTWNTTFKIISNVNNSTFGIKNLKIETLGYEEIDIYEGENIVLNYSISDIREYYNRLGVYSLNIVIPGTERNLNFFNYINDVNIDSKININKKFDAILSTDDIQFITGFIFIDNVEISDDKCEINIQFYGEQLNLFKSIGDDLLENMDWSELDHVYTKTKLYNSWLYPTSGNDKIVYPWLDYGNLNWSLGGCVGKATDKYPSLGLVGRDFYPGVSLKYILDEIISQYGYEYEFDLGDEDWFRKIFIPFNNEREKLFRWNLSTRAIYKEASFSNFNIGTNNTYGYFNSNVSIKFYKSGIVTSYNPPSNNTARWIKNDIELYRNFNYGLGFNSYATYPSYLYKHPTIIAAGDNSPINIINPENYQVNQTLPGSYLCRHDGKYKFKFKFKSTSTFTVSGVNEGLYKLNVYLCKTNKNSFRVVNDLIAVPKEFIFEGTEDIIKVGYYVSNLNVTSNMPYVFKYLDNDGNITSSVPNNTNIILERELDCNEDDLVYFKFEIVNEIPGATVTWRIIPDYFEGYEWEWGEGNQVLGKNIIPSNIKIKDLLKDIITLFNLYIDIDENNPKKLYFYTRDEYYNIGGEYDLTHKLDLDNKIELRLPSEFQNTINIIKYKTDSDYFNNVYTNEKDIQKIGFGSKRFIVDNDNISGINTLELSVFASSPLWSVWGLNGVSGKEQFVMTSFWNKEYGSDERQSLQTNWMPRLLFFNKQLIYDNNFTNTNDKTTFLVNADSDYYYDGMAKWYYPYAGHILYPYDLENTDNYDLNFTTALRTNNLWQKTFKGFPENTMTGNNLFNLYYRNIYEELSNKNSRLFTAYFKLDINDIINMKLNSIIQLNNSLYRINKIIDFTPSGENLTKVELIKILDYNSNWDVFISDDNPNVVIIEKEPIRLIESIREESFELVDDKLVINKVKSINQEQKIIEADNKATYINNLKIKGGEILKINSNIDGGLIEIDGVFNPFYFRDKHYNDSGEIESKSILDINIWKLRDGGLI